MGLIFFDINGKEIVFISVTNQVYYCVEIAVLGYSVQNPCYKYLGSVKG